MFSAAQPCTQVVAYNRVTTRSQLTAKCQGHSLLTVDRRAVLLIKAVFVSDPIPAPGTVT